MTSCGDPDPAGRWLLLDDDDLWLRATARDLGRQSIQAVCTRTVAQAQTLVRQHAPAVAVVDLRLRCEAGYDFMEWAASAGVAIGVVVVSADASIAQATAAIRRGAREVVEKPCSALELIRAATVVDTELTGAPQPVLSLWEAKRAYLRTVTRAAPTRAAAARLLEIEPRSLRRMLQKYGLESG